MGDVILLDQRRADRSRPTRNPRPALFFDLSCPLSYLAAEQAERLFGDVEWVPVSAAAVGGELDPSALVSLREHAERRAGALRLPLVWPDRFPAGVPRALRAADFASELGAGARFALAASRLAFCGGFDLEDPETLAEAAAAAAVPLGACLEAAGDIARDTVLEATAAGLRSRGVRALPAVRAGRRWFTDESGWSAAAAAPASRREPGRPLAPVG